MLKVWIGALLKVAMVPVIFVKRKERRGDSSERKKDASILQYSETYFPVNSNVFRLLHPLEVTNKCFQSARVIN